MQTAPLPASFQSHSSCLLAFMLACTARQPAPSTISLVPAPSTISLACIVYLSRTSFVQSTCYCCHSYYSASFFSLSLFLSLSPLARPFYNLIGALSTSHEPHSFSRPATVVTHTTQPLFFSLSLFLSLSPLARPFYNLIGALSTSHEPHSFSRPATVVTHTTQPLFFSLSLFLSLSPLARPFYNLIGALSTSHEPHSFSRPATVVTHTTQPLFFLFLSFFHSARWSASKRSYSHSMLPFILSEYEVKQTVILLLRCHI